MGPPLRGVAVAIAIALACARSLAGERLIRDVDWRTGAPMSSVGGLDQDADGFLWLSTPQGLVRYDGAEMRFVHASTRGIIRGCARSGHLRVLRDAGSRLDLVEIVGMQAVAIPPPEGVEFRFPEEAACSEDGALWITSNGNLWRKGESDGWKKMPAVAAWDGVWPAREGGVLAKAKRELFRVASDGTAEHLARVGFLVSCFLREDGELVTLEWRSDGGHVILERDGRVQDVATLPGRPIAMTERAGTIWASYDGGLVGVRSDRSTIRIPASPSTFVGGGPLLVDREGALWVGTPRGLVELPEPETGGIDPSEGGRWLHRFGAELFLSAWHGTQRIVETDGRWTLVPVFEGVGAVCRDARGRTWGTTFETLLRTDRNGHVTSVPFEHVGDLAPCALDAEGVLWMPTLRGLLRLERDRDLPSVERLPPSNEGDSVYSLLLDRHGVLWAGATGRVCSKEASAGTSRPWRCETVPGSHAITDLIETDRGDVWAASQGVCERGGDGAWNPLSFESGQALTPIVSGLAPSPRGGVWLLGQGAILRVAGESSQGRMTVLERLGSWQGIPSFSTYDASEDVDGTLWLSADSAVVRVPAGVRGAPVVPTRVAVTSIKVDDETLPSSREFRSPYRRNRIEVRVSAFSYRDPSLVLYRFRMRDDDPWSEPTSNSVFQFYNVSSGRYAMSFAASLDGLHWTETPAPVRFRVDRPWFLQPWFFAILVALAATVAWLVHRARVARLLALAHQRTRIAMDLHDAIGSGLGSIGLLAGLGSRPATDAEKGHELSHQIATTAAELGMSLSEIVWSLRPGSERLESLAQYLKDRGNKLFVEEGARFATQFPSSWPDTALSLPLRRNLLLIAVEALSNAATHAQASEIRLGMGPAGSGWSLWVEDDGLGVDRGVNPGGGMGLENMKRRAEEIDARVEWSQGAIGGTRMTVFFDPRFDGARGGKS